MHAMKLLILGLAIGCTRPSDNYDVHVYGAATDLDSIESAPQEMGGQIEYARYRFWGTNLGHGLTGLWGDEPRADGTSVTIGYANFGYPKDRGFDQNSTFLSPGPKTVEDGVDSCNSRTQTTGYYSFMEYVDVGDHIELKADDNTFIRLERDPTVHHRPAGESWYAGYGGSLHAVIQDHDYLPSNWASDTNWSIRFPGTVLPSESTVGAIPYPLVNGSLQFPPDIEGLRVNGQEVRAPHHGYDDLGKWTGEDDDIRFPGPWNSDSIVNLNWTPYSSETGDSQPLTIVIRLLGSGEESACDCNSDCSDGFSCQDGNCYGDEGAGWAPVGELACTVADDGDFSFKPEMMSDLWKWVDRSDVQGAVLLVSRQRESTLNVPDALTYNGKRVSLTPVRTRALDIIATRLIWEAE
jgi:hypothetical protein